MCVEHNEYGSAGKDTDQWEVARVHIAALEALHAEIDGEHPMAFCCVVYACLAMSSQAAAHMCHIIAGSAKKVVYHKQHDLLQG